jgi:ribose/xylose/arabinose/galactoside ABC-type transport system permease subunit
MYFVSSGGSDAAAVNVTFENSIIKYIGKGEPLPGVQLGVIVMFLFFIVYGIWVNLTKYGAKLTLVGGNPRAARLAGINPKRMTFLLYVNSAVLSGVAGVFTAARISQGSLTALQTNQFTGMTAAILGGISFGGGSGGMGGAFVGLLILNTFQIGMTSVGVSTYWVSVFTGLILILALSVDFLSQQRKLKVTPA